MASTDVATIQEADPPRAGGAMLALTASTLIDRRNQMHNVMATVMKANLHYGVIPGTDNQPVLLKPGIDLIASVFQLAYDYDVRDQSGADEVKFVVTCRVTSQLSGAFLGSGLGLASSEETKYRWRSAGKAEWEATPQDRRREKFSKDGKRYPQVRQEAADVANTVLKMAAKRAAGAAVMAVTPAAEVFTTPEEMEAIPPERRARAVRGQTPAKVSTKQLDELEKLAARKGRNLDQVAILLAERGYEGALEDITPEAYDWLMAGLAGWSDKADPETGEVVEQAEGADDDDSDDLPF